MTEHEDLRNHDRMGGPARFWGRLSSSDMEGGGIAYRCPNTVLILSKKSGAEIGNGIRGFAVRSSVFDALERNAGIPSESGSMGNAGFVRLFPRMLLRKGAWEQDVDLLRYSKEIARGLIELFGIDPEFVWERVRNHAALYHEGVVPIHGGTLLDVVLEEVAGAIGRCGSSPENCSAVWE
jgi:hypothetical protein